MLDDVPVDRIGEFQREFRRYMGASHPEISSAIEDKKALDADLEKRLADAINEFKNSTGFVQTTAPGQAAS
jgi:F-type H+-transporting ATPase subunit alpha